MATTYITRDGDTADSIAWRYYGSTASRETEALLEANPGLADQGPELPAGLRIALPEISAPVTTQGVRLWD